VFGRTLMRLDIEPMGDAPFRCDATLRMLPGLSLASMSTSGTRVARTRELISDGKNDFCIGISREGAGFFSRPGREAPLAEGGGVLCRSSEPGALAFRSAAQFVLLSIPAEILMPLIRDPDTALGRPIPPDAGALRLLSGYLDLLLHGSGFASAELQASAASHVHDLVALAIGATRDAAHAASGRGARAARLAAIRADILANLSQVRLSPGLIARRHAVSERYIHLLFEDTGETFGEFVTAARLDRARALLTETPQLKIADIAHRAGYGEITTFNRAFRRRFGQTPSDLRGTVAPRRESA
jgi:AraC-like DNA-binding protein